MPIDYQYGSSISEAIRNILLCRVKLVSSAVAGQKNIEVSNVGDRVYPGNRFFLNYSDAAVIVQPTVADTADGILHQENVTIHDDTWAEDNKIIASSNLVNSYTTAAYIRPATIPTICSGLKFIDRDFIPSLNFAPKDEWFPGAIVTRLGMKQDFASAAGTLEFEYHFRVYYCDILQDDRNNSDTLWDAGEVLKDLVTGDNYLSGTVNESDVTEMVPWFSSELAQRGFRFVTATHGLDVGWIQFDIATKRYSSWKKHSSTE